MAVKNCSNKRVGFIHIHTCIHTYPYVCCMDIWKCCGSLNFYEEDFVGLKSKPHVAQCILPELDRKQILTCPYRIEVINLQHWPTLVWNLFLKYYIKSSQRSCSIDDIIFEFIKNERDELSLVFNYFSRVIFQTMDTKNSCLNFKLFLDGK